MHTSGVNPYSTNGNLKYQTQQNDAALQYKIRICVAKEQHTLVNSIKITQRAALKSQTK